MHKKPNLEIAKRPNCTPRLGFEGDQRLKSCPSSPAQALLLRAAARRVDGRVIPPANLRGGARVKAMTALMRREWIEASDGG